MVQAEDSLTQVARHVREGEARVFRQVASVARLLARRARQNPERDLGRSERAHHARGAEQDEAVA
jgi:hypothetical protein